MLLERDRETATLSAALGRASAGSGGLVLLRGQAGAGKTSLLRAAQRLGQQRGLLVLTARGAEFEQDFPFGTARQLLEPLIRAMAAHQRERLFEGSASLCRPLFTDQASPIPTEDRSAAMVEGLSWLLFHLAASHRQGLLLTVDDVHVCDRATLRVLARLALGLHSARLAVVAAQRLGAPGRNHDLIDWLAADPGNTVIEPCPLSHEAIGTMVRARLGTSAADLIEACREVTGGNPFLVEELLAALRTEGLANDDAATIRRVRELVPDAVLHSVTARVRRLGDEAERVARAVAVLGPDALLPDAATLADLSEATTLREAGRLTDEGLLSEGPLLAFRHPLLAAAVERDLHGVERTSLHARAAAILGERGAPDERIAAHLLVAPPAGDQRAVEVLRRAAAANLQRGGPDGAVPLLRRALAEPPTEEECPAVVLELARAEAAVGDPAAYGRLVTALELVEGRDQRIAAMRHLTRLQFLNEHFREAAVMARRAWSEAGPDDPLALELLAEYVAIGGFGSRTTEPAIRRETEALVAGLTTQYFRGSPPEHPALCVQLANLLAAGRGRRSDVIDLVQRAIDLGTTLGDLAPFGLAPTWATLALVAADVLDLAGQIAEQGHADAEGRGSLQEIGTATFSVAIVALESGQLDRAELWCNRALELTRSGVPATLPWSAALLATNRRLRGDLAGARRALEVGLRSGPESYIHGIVLYHQALLALAEDDPRRCLEDALAARDRLTDIRMGDYALTAWRIPAAAAAHRLGRHDEALEYVEEELALAHRSQAPKQIGVALVCQAALSPDPDRQVTLLEEARAVLADSQARLARSQCAFRLGRALARHGAVPASREPLQEALDLAAGCDAQPLARSVRAELRRHGLRPDRRRRPTGKDSLSEAERRVAVLASEGWTNRDIAADLHLSLSTVEFHLTRCYRKLGIRSRAELAEALGV